MRETHGAEHKEAHQTHVVPSANGPRAPQSTRMVALWSSGQQSLWHDRLADVIKSAFRSVDASQIAAKTKTLPDLTAAICLTFSSIHVLINPTIVVVVTIVYCDIKAIATDNCGARDGVRRAAQLGGYCAAKYYPARIHCTEEPKVFSAAKVVWHFKVIWPCTVSAA